LIFINVVQIFSKTLNAESGINATNDKVIILAVIPVVIPD